MASSAVSVPSVPWPWVPSPPGPLGPEEAEVPVPVPVPVPPAEADDDEADSDGALPLEGKAAHPPHDSRPIPPKMAARLLLWPAAEAEEVGKEEAGKEFWGTSCSKCGWAFSAGPSSIPSPAGRFLPEVVVVVVGGGGGGDSSS